MHRGKTWKVDVWEKDNSKWRKAEKQSLPNRYQNRNHYPSTSAALTTCAIQK